MRVKGAALLALCLVLALPVAAAERVTLGWGRMFVNDAMGDGEDRWRTGSYTLSRVRGLRWDGLPSAHGEVLEWRARAEIIAPANLRRAPAGDRRYVGLLSLGLHSHAEWQGWDTRLGADLVVIGPQTGMASLQETLHDLLGMPAPLVAGSQLGNKVLPTLSAEAARPLRLGPATLRPFVEMQAGVETFVRVGGDLTFGRIGSGLLIREAVTGQRYAAVSGTATPGLSLVLGGDLARVFDSALLPDDAGPAPRKTRSRLRAGVQWQGDRAEAFYGLSLLGKEFDTQPEAQLTGAISLRLRF